MSIIVPAAPTAAAGGPPHAIVATGIEKRYGGTRALKGVSLALEAGRIHALVGENGAGKSTLLGIIAGRVRPTAGRAEVFGREQGHGDPRQARRDGIAAIYQELTIIPALTARANVFLGQAYARFGLLSERRMNLRFAELCRQFGVAIPANARAASLSVADQQMLEIMRGVESRASVILFDEPTTSLAPPERDSLFRTMRDLRAAGSTMMLVSHNLDEVLDIADTVTVFKDGEVVASETTPHWTKASLVRAMIGHDLAAPAVRTPPLTSGISRFTATEINLANGVTDISVDVAAGEILGIGGLVGSGRTSLLRCLAGLEPQSHGKLSIDGRQIAWPRSVRSALAVGIALVPEDRKSQGLVLGRSAAENIALTRFSDVSRFGLVSDGAMRRAVAPVARAYGVDPARLGAAVRNLSGGNQQKVLLSKWQFRPPRLLLVDEPTRGIDIGAKEEILATLRRRADEGLAIILVSSELDEIVALSDRVVVLSEGRRVAELDARAAPIQINDILNAAFRVN
ncbi:MAG: sugar ABC transporter ATP-binding protein [Devosia sp.]|nr:sugar ABC transporter ATP-binding protein [Devosia sp.]